MCILLAYFQIFGGLSKLQCWMFGIRRRKQINLVHQEFMTLSGDLDPSCTNHFCSPPRNRKATLHRSPVPGTELPHLVLWRPRTVMGHRHLQVNTEPLVEEGTSKLHTERINRKSRESSSFVSDTLFGSWLWSIYGWLLSQWILVTSVTMGIVRNGGGKKDKSTQNAAAVRKLLNLKHDNNIRMCTERYQQLSCKSAVRGRDRGNNYETTSFSVFCHNRVGSQSLLNFTLTFHTLDFRNPVVRT